MNSSLPKPFVRARNLLSREEKEVFSAVQKFLQGIAQKDKLLLEEVLDEEARIELRWRKSGNVVGKDRYLQIVAGDNSFHRSDFEFLDVIIERQGNSVLAKGIFMFQGEPFSSCLLWIKLIKKDDKWRVLSNGFSFLDFEPESVPM